MWIWIIILSFLIVLSILEFACLWNDESVLDIVSVFVVFISVVALICIIAQGTEYAVKATEYQNTQGLYLDCESNCGIEEAETILFTQERNEWIEEAQIARKTFGAFSFYPEEVLDLEFVEKCRK